MESELYPGKPQRKYNGIIFSLLILMTGLGSILWLNNARLRIIRQSTAVVEVLKQINQENLHVLTRTEEVQLLQMTDETTLLPPVLQDIKQRSHEITELTNLLINGGDYHYPAYSGIFQGSDVKLKPLNTDNGLSSLNDFKTLWQHYLQSMTATLQTSVSLNPEKTDTLVRIGKTNRLPAQAYLDAVYNRYMQQNDRQIRQNLWLQMAVILLLLTYLIFFTRYFLQQIQRADNEIALAQKETYDILRTVNEGHLLLNRDLLISNRYSEKLKEIIGISDIAQKSLEDLLQPMISAKDMEVTKEFIEQLFNENVIEALIGDLNPLTHIRAVIMKDGAPQTRYLSFHFARVYEGEYIAKVLVSIRDITKETELEKRLAKERQENDGQIDMLSAILPVEPVLLQHFIRQAHQSCENINHILRYQGSGGTLIFKEKIKALLVEIHRLKGDASSSGLGHFVDICSQMEQCLHTLERQKNLSGNHFLPLAVQFEQLLELTEKVSRIYSRVHHSEPIETLGESHSGQLLDAKNLCRFAEQIARRNNRMTALQCTGLDMPLPLEKQLLLKDLIIQLLRNAIVHGIESPTARSASGKTETGHIKIYLEEKHNQQYRLVFADDGRGIDFEQLRTMALKTPAFAGRTPESLSKNELLRFMLSAGVSTQAFANEDAGCGIGTEIISACIRRLNARLSIQTRPRQGTCFTIIFTV